MSGEVKLNNGQKLMVEDGFPAELFLSAEERKARWKGMRTALTSGMNFGTPAKADDPQTAAFKAEIEAKAKAEAKAARKAKREKKRDDDRIKERRRQALEHLAGQEESMKLGHPPTPEEIEAIPAGSKQKEAPMAAAKKTDTKTTARKAPPQGTQRRPAAKKTAQASKAAAAKAARTPASDARRTRYDWTAAADAAKNGKIPPALNLEAECHAPYRDKFADLQKMANSKDVAGLKKAKIPSYNSTTKALGRWRDLALQALS